MRSFVLGILVGAGAASFVAYVAWPAAMPVAAPLAVVSVPTARPPVSPALIPQLAGANAAPAPAPVAVPAPAAPLPRAAAAPEPAAIPIALSAEHAKMLLPDAKGRPPTLPELHAELVGEGKDPAWSLATEQSIRQVLAADNASGEFDIMNVDCRSSMCEVLAFGNLPNSAEGWNQAMTDMKKESWYSGIRGESTAMGVQNGRYTVVTIFQRKR